MVFKCRHCIPTLVLIAITICGCISGAAEVPGRIIFDKNAVYPSASSLDQYYPSTIIRGEVAYDTNELLSILLGEGYTKEERSEFSYQDIYHSVIPEKSSCKVTISDLSNIFTFRNSIINGDRGGEYQAPSMGISIDESIQICIKLLDGIVDDAWLSHPGNARQIEERWTSAGWMTEKEYDAYIRRMDAHYFEFENWYNDRVRILDNEITVSLGLDGLSMLRIAWNHFRESGSESIVPIPLEDVVEIISSNLFAQLVYSNRITENDNYNLSWYLYTSAGGYIYDCVLNRCVQN